jgi:hypothetical protein
VWFPNSVAGNTRTPYFVAFFTCAVVRFTVA